MKQIKKFVGRWSAVVGRGTTPRETQTTYDLRKTTYEKPKALLCTITLSWLFSVTPVMAQSQPNLVTLHGSSTAITDTQTHYACENIIVPFANSPTYEVTKTGGNTGNVHLSTGHTVYMRDGFEITDGGEFWARTSIDSGNCQAYCGDTVGMLDIGARPDTFVSLGSDSFRYQSNIIESYLPDSHVATFNSMYVSLNHVAIAEDVPGYYDGICQTDTLNDFNLDVILPIDTEDGNDGLKPVILLGAGGAFLKDGHNNPKFQLIVTEFAKRGFAMFIYEYRQGYPNDAAPEIDQGDTTFCSTLPDSCDVWEYRVRQAIYRGHQDILHAIRYLKWEAANGNEFNIDTNKLIIGGFSAAGFNALHAAYMEQTEWDAIDTNLRNDLGPLDAISDSIYAPDTVDRRMHTVDIAGVLNMWGAVVDKKIFLSQLGFNILLPSPAPTIYLKHYYCLKTGTYGAVSRKRTGICRD